MVETPNPDVKEKRVSKPRARSKPSVPEDSSQAKYYASQKRAREATANLARSKRLVPEGSIGPKHATYQGPEYPPSTARKQGSGSVILGKRRSEKEAIEMEAAEIYSRLDRELAVEEARADRLLRFYNL